MLEVLIAGFVVGITHAVPPGPITFEVLRRGASEGLASALMVDAGAVAADAVFFVLVVAGMTQVINNEYGRLALWLGGSSLLMFLGVRGIWRAIASGRNAIGTPGAGGKKYDAPPFLTGFLICITSPFAIIWWASIFAGSFTMFAMDVVTMAMIFAGIAIACLAWYALVGLSGRLSRSIFNAGTVRALSLLCSAMMIVFSIVLLYKGYLSFI